VIEHHAFGLAGRFHELAQLFEFSRPDERRGRRGLQFLRERPDDIPPQHFNELRQSLKRRTVLFGRRLLELHIYKDGGRPNFGL
jgi:hypothetical protein